MKQKNQLELSFFNTVHLSGDRLKEAEKKVTRQGRMILEWMAERGHPVTPIEVWDALEGRVLLTSVRRTMTNLSDVGLIVKTGEMRPERFGQPNHLWSLPGNCQDCGKPCRVDTNHGRCEDCQYSRDEYREQEWRREAEGLAE